MIHAITSAAFALFLALLAGPAFADCAPRTWLNPTDRATPEIIASDPAGEYRSWWCQQPDGTWALDLNVVLKGYGGPEVMSSVASVILAASSPTDGIRAARQRFSRLPSTPQERYDFLRLVWLACKNGIANPPPNLSGPPVDNCGSAPVLQQAWVVDPATAADGTRPAFPLVNGVRGTTSNGRATSGQPCDPSKGQVPASGGKAYAVFGPAFDVTKVALCSPTPG